MATKYQNYADTNYDSGADEETAPALWIAQTFTPTIQHYVTSVKPYTRRIGSPGTLTASIRAVDGDSKPTGNDLAVGSINGNGITTSYVLNIITLTTPYLLTASIKYAIVLRAPASSVDSSNVIQWGYDGSSPTYTGGKAGTSTDSGVNWTMSSGVDQIFEEWGVLGLPSDAISRVTSLTHRYDRGTYTLELNLGEVVADFGLPEWESKPRAGVPEPSFQERMERTAKQLQDEADMSRQEALYIARKLETMEEITRREQGDRRRTPTTPPVQKKSFAELMEEAKQAGLSPYEARKVAQYEEDSNR